MSGQRFGRGAVLVFERTNSEHRHRDAHCRHNAGKTLALTLLLSGSARVEQYGHGAMLSAGDCYLLHAGAPFTSVSRDFKAVSLLYDERTASRWLPDVQAACGIALSHASPWGKALSSAMAALAHLPLPHLPVPSDAVIDQINCLLALTADPGQPDSGTYRASLFQRLQQILRLQTSNCGFGPTECAELCGVSLRTLHMTFASHGTSFCKELKAIRLRMARDYLDDAKFDRKTVAEIAALCGYAHPSHFITSFGKAYGLPPMKYRKTRRS